MKIRTGFVSNSSSSSFVISLEDVTAKQVKKILAHQIKGRKMEIAWADTNPWGIEVTDTEIQGSTMMDNFNMGEFLRRIGVPDSAITWGTGTAWAWER